MPWPVARPAGALSRAPKGHRQVLIPAQAHTSVVRSAPSGAMFGGQPIDVPLSLSLKSINRSSCKDLKIKGQEITSAGEDVEEREPVCTVGGTVSWYGLYGKQCGGSSET